MFQLSLFHRICPPIFVVPSSPEPIALGPAPFWCEECCEDVYPVAFSEINSWDSRTREYVCLVVQRCPAITCECGTGHGRCENCESCEECCECYHCGYCGNPTADYCGECDRCDDCCPCIHCSSYRCSRVIDSDGCSECERCDYCGCACVDEDDEDDVPDYDPCCRYVGVEIEFVGSMSTVTREIEDSCVEPGWDVKYDGSVSSGGEFASRVLDWNEPSDRRDLEKCVRAIRTTGATTSDATGLHVHVDARGMSDAAIARVGVWGHDYEDPLYRLASSGDDRIRSGMRTYAKPIPLDYALSLRAVADGSRDRSYARGRGRYYCVNMESNHQTVEFRVFNSSLDFATVSAWVTLCAAVVQSAREGKTPSPEVRHALGDMASGGTDSLDSLLGGLSPYMSDTDEANIRGAWVRSYPQAA